MFAPLRPGRFRLHGIALALVIVAAGVAVRGPHTLAAPAGTSLQFHFAAHTISGISDGTSNTVGRYGQVPAVNFTGRLSIFLHEDGVYDGVLTLDDGSTIDIYGQVSGLDMSVVLSLGGDSYLLGSGVTNQSLQDPTAATTLVGGGMFLDYPGDRLGVWQITHL